MPKLAWRTGADGFAFVNSWTFVATERAALSAATQPVVAAAAGPVAPILIPTMIGAACGGSSRMRSVTTHG